MQNKWTHILHIADIHIRNYTRHYEYRKVFDKLYKAVDNTPDSTLVYIGGDIVHSKTDMSPELIRLTSEFLTNLADRRTTVFIKGNHDANLNNESRLDALRPIYDTLAHPNLHYLDEPKIYTFGNIDFSIFEISSDKSAWPGPGENDINIALFHGPVYQSSTDVGYVISSDSVKSNDFSGFDLALLGDIHKRQMIDDNIYYPGSLVQQNFGESQDNHGYTLWDLFTFEHRHYELTNDNAHCTVYVESGQIISDVSKLTANPKIRIFHTDTTESELKHIVSELKSKCKPIDVVQIKQDKIRADVASKKSTKAIDTRNVEYQNKLLKSHLERVHSTDPETVDEILKINEALNKHLVASDVARHVEWKLVDFEFSNMFSYGENNRINFSDMSGLVGLFAKNHTGKSALLDSIMFCLFDRCSRTTKAESVLNNNRKTFECTVHIEVEGQPYYIQRKARRKANGKVKCDVNFWTFDDEGQKNYLNGEQRAETNAIIRKLIGTYEDFILTALSVQNDSTGFIDKSQTEKKDLLSQFLDITVFDQLQQLATEEISEMRVLIKDFKKIDYATKLDECKIQLDSNRKLMVESLKTDKELKSKKLAIGKSIQQLQSSLAPVKVYDKAAIQKNIELMKSKIGLSTTKLETNATKEKEQNLLLQKCLDWLDNYDRTELSAAVNTLKGLNKDLLQESKQLSKAKNTYTNAKSLSEQLHDHEYDPNCKFCCNNDFVKKAETAKTNLDVYVHQITKCQESVDLITKLKDETETKVELFSKYQKVENKINEVKLDLRSINIDNAKHITAIGDANTKLLLAQSELVAYEKNKELIQENANIQLEIDTLTETLDEYNEDIETNRDDIIEYKSNVKLYTSTRDEINETMARAYGLEQKLKYYDLYLASIKRDGLPYEIISDSLPELEAEVNEVLTQITDFKLIFDTDGKNINTYITYGEKPWDLSLASGMEKFVSSLAIRNGLIQLSSLPRPTFIAIDEGFGNLDSDNLDSIKSLFEHITSLFDFIIIITHIDYMKDIPDSLLEISVQEGYSYVAN